MAKYFFIAGLVLIIGLFFCIGIRYIREVKASTQQTDPEFNKQEYVKDNRNKFGVSNKGTSMDERRIYVKSPSDFGV